MVKIVIHIAKALVAVITALLFFSCGLGGLKQVEGSGNVVKQNRPAQEEFSSISVSEGLEVIVEQGTVRSIVVEADDNLHQHIKTEIKNKKLEISSDANISGTSTKRIIVTLPHIDEVTASSSATVKSKSTLTGESMAFSVSSGANMDITVDAENVSLESGSGAFMKVNGKAEDLQAESSSGGTVNAKGLTAQTVQAEASSGGTTYVNPVEKLSADASSGGTVLYTSTPNKLEMDKSSGGSVKQG